MNLDSASLEHCPVLCGMSGWGHVTGHPESFTTVTAKLCQPLKSTVNYN